MPSFSMGMPVRTAKRGSRSPLVDMLVGRWVAAQLVADQPLCSSTSCLSVCLSALSDDPHIATGDLRHGPAAARLQCRAPGSLHVDSTHPSFFRPHFVRVLSTDCQTGSLK